MDENQKKPSDSEGNYNPYEEYVRQKISQEKQEEYGDSYRRYTDPDMGPQDDPGRGFRPRRRKPTQLEIIGFILSIASLICCCCANIYITLGAAIMALAVTICSRFFANEEGRFHPLAIAAIVISIVCIAVVIFLLVFYLVIYPQLLEDPTYRQMLEQMEKILQEQLQTSPSGAAPASGIPDDGSI